MGRLRAAVETHPGSDPERAHLYLELYRAGAELELPQGREFVASRSDAPRCGFLAAEGDHALHWCAGEDAIDNVDDGTRWRTYWIARDRAAALSAALDPTDEGASALRVSTVDWISERRAKQLGRGDVALQTVIESCKAVYANARTGRMAYVCRGIDDMCGDYAGAADDLYVWETIVGDGPPEAPLVR